MGRQSRRSVAASIRFGWMQPKSPSDPEEVEEDEGGDMDDWKSLPDEEDDEFEIIAMDTTDSALNSVENEILQSERRWRSVGSNCNRRGAGTSRSSWFRDTYEARMAKYDGENMETTIEPVIERDLKKIVLVTHDESTFYANDGKKLIWMQNSKKKLLPKTNGSSIMISGFCCECHGFMVDEALNKKSYILFQAGTNREGWWKNDDLVRQCKDVFELIEKLHPESVILFAFDNSMNHHKRAPDGLDASLLPLKDDGKNAPKMRNTEFLQNGVRINQQMQTSSGGQKGVRSILIERGIWRVGMLLECQGCRMNVPHANRKNVFSLKDDSYELTIECCGRYRLSQEPDFLAQKEWLREEIEGRGHQIIYYPKFHCELNYIEMIWAYVKANLRKNCTYSFEDLKIKLPGVIENIPISFFRKAARHAFRFMSGYRLNIEGPLLEFAMKRYSSHRRIPFAKLTEIRDAFERTRAKKRKIVK